jgi:hypothetical protein
LQVAPERRFFLTFNLLRASPNKSSSALAMAAVPSGSSTVPFVENANALQSPFRRPKLQNPFRCPIASLTFVVGFVTAAWLGVGARLLVDKATSLGFWQTD